MEGFQVCLTQKKVITACGKVGCEVSYRQGLGGTAVVKNTGTAMFYISYSHEIKYG